MDNHDDKKFPRSADGQKTPVPPHGNGSVPPGQRPVPPTRPANAPARPSQPNAPVRPVNHQPTTPVRPVQSPASAARPNQPNAPVRNGQPIHNASAAQPNTPLRVAQPNQPNVPMRNGQPMPAPAQPNQPNMPMRNGQPMPAPAQSNQPNPPTQPNAPVTEETAATDEKKAEEGQESEQGKKRKLSKKERKQIEKEQLALEKQLIKEKKIPPRINYKPRHTFGRIVAICLAFLFGVISAIGGLVGALFIVGTNFKTKDVMNLVGVKSEEVLSETAAEMTVLDLVDKVTKDLETLNGFDNFNLNILDEYTPILKTKLLEVNEQLVKVGVTLNIDDLMAKNFGELGDYVSNDVLPSIALADVLKIQPDSTDSVMRALCYKSDGSKTTIGDLTNEEEGGATALLKGIALADALGIQNDETADALMRALCYQSDGSKVTIGALIDDGTNVLSDIALADALSVKDDNTADPLMHALCYKSDGSKVTIGALIDDGTGVLGGIALADALKVKADDPEADRLMKELCFREDGSKVTIQNLIDSGSDVIKDVHLGEALSLTPESDDVMIALCYGKEGVDYEIVNGAIQPKTHAEGTTSKFPVTVGGLTESASDILGDIEIELLLGTNGKSDAALRYLAYGSQTEEVDGATVTRYTIAEDGTVTMNGNYTKRTINDLTAEDADIIGGATIGDIIAVDENSSNILKAIGSWQINDFSNQSKLESLKISDVLDVEKNATGLMGAIKNKTLAELKDQNTIESLYIGDVLAVDENATGLMGAIKGKTLGELKDQSTLEGLKIGDVLAVEKNATGLMGAIKNKTLGELKDQDTLEGLKIGEVLNIPENETGLMGAIGGWTLGEMKQQQRIERLKISQVITVGDNPSRLMSAIQDWRITELTEQAKINSLTLSDVLSINTDSPLLLQSVQNTPVGALGNTINSLRLQDILEEEGFADNNILKNLKQSTLVTLAEDIKKLTVAQVFGDDLYAFLSPDDMLVAFNAAKATLPAGTDYTDITKGTYEEFVKAYPKNSLIKELSQVVPQAITPQAGEKIVTYYVTTASLSTASPVRVTRAYFFEGGTQPEESELMRNAAGYYAKRELRLNPVYAWKIVTYTSGGYAELPAGDTVSADGSEYVSGKTSYPIKSDDYGFYYEKDGTRIDLERVISYYTASGVSEHITLNTNGEAVIGGNTYPIYTAKGEAEYSYILERLPVTEKFVTAGETPEQFNASEVTERYELVKADGSKKQLDRYLSGVWYLLFGGEKDGAILDDSQKSVLDIGKNITDAASKVNELTLGDLYLHGFITSNPYQDISRVHATYKNLNRLTISAVIDLVIDLTERISSIPAIGG